MAELVIKGDKILLLEHGEKEVRFHGHHVSITSGSHIEAFPSGHFLANPVEITSNGEVINDNPRFRNWLSQPFVDTVLSKEGYNAAYEVVQLSDSRSSNLIVLNCLDACYGHAMYKLFNAARYEKLDWKVVVIIHSNFQHFVPEYVDEIWLVKTSFFNQDNKLNGFHEFVKNQLNNYQQIELVETDMALNLGDVDLTAFTKVQPFDFQRFAEGEPYQITLLLREDRMWLSSKIDQWLYLVWKKTAFDSLKKYLQRKERSNYKRLISHVNQSIQVKWTAIGIGKGLRYSFLDDQRMDYDSFTQNEQNWCEHYASSHLCIGVHGSNMLIPSYLSGAFVSLIPEFKIPNYSEDFLPRNEPIQRTLFTARNLPASIKSKELAHHVVSVLQGYLHGMKKTMRD